MKYLLDTCVISEAIKRRPNENVLGWLANQTETSLYLSVLTFGEIEKGIEKAIDDGRKSELRAWVENDLRTRFAGRVIPIDLDTCTLWGSVQAKAERVGKPMPTIDGLIAVSAIINKCIVVTRNTTDMKQSGVNLLNPWQLEPQ